MTLVHSKLGRLMLRQGSLQSAGTLREAQRRVNFGAESLDTPSAACRLVITIMAAVS
jgi:hypothetical protein